ncbi:hypothetical protein M3Y99_01452500 [Aphelenchoides fujianensis]|nr:hypothetical protein M3Y99_01452500 [Aphelenchoides fujianensis]
MRSGRRREEEAARPGSSLEPKEEEEEEEVAELDPELTVEFMQAIFNTPSRTRPLNPVVSLGTIGERSEETPPSSPPAEREEATPVAEEAEESTSAAASASNERPNRKRRSATTEEVRAESIEEEDEPKSEKAKLEDTCAELKVQLLKTKIALTVASLDLQKFLLFHEKAKAGVECSFVESDGTRLVAKNGEISLDIAASPHRLVFHLECRRAGRPHPTRRRPRAAERGGRQAGQSGR